MTDSSHDPLLAEAPGLMAAGERFAARRLLVEKGRELEDRAEVLAFLEEHFPFTRGWADRLAVLADRGLAAKERAAALRAGEPPSDPRFAGPVLDLIEALVEADEENMIGVVVAQGERCLGRGDLQRIRFLATKIPPRPLPPGAPPALERILLKKPLETLADRLSKGETPLVDRDFERRLARRTASQQPRVTSIALLGGLVAIAEGVRRVEVHFTDEDHVSVFDTVHEGGRMLLVPCARGTLLVVGGYYRGGVAGYEVRKGERVWRRRDFVLSSDLVILPPGPGGQLQLGVGCNSHDCARPALRGPEDYQIVSACEGGQIAELLDVRGLLADPAASVVVAAGTRAEHSYLLRAESWDEIADLGPGSPLDAAFDADRVAVAGGKRGLRCFDHRGRLLWSWRPENECNVVGVARHEATGGWVVVEAAGGYRVVLLSGEGREEARAAPEVPEALSTFAMSRDGGVIACADRTIRALPGLEVIQRLPRPELLDATDRS